MKNKTNALQRSKKYLEGLGYHVGIVERWIPPRGKMEFGVRQDLFGFGDLLAFHPGLKCIAIVQCFPTARWEDHVNKILALPEAQKWKEAGGLLALHGWSWKVLRDSRGGPVKIQKTGESKYGWVLREALL